MDCRTARALSTQSRLTPAEQQAYRAHLADCAACHDDANDPLSRALSQTMIEMALPPPDFTSKLMQRLPKESPLELAQHATRHEQRWRVLTGVGVAALAGVVVVLGMVLQPLWAGTALGVVAQVVRDVVGAMLGPLVMTLAGAIAVGLLLQVVLRNPTTRAALGSAALACALLVVFGLAIRVSDQNVAADSGSVITLSRSIQTAQDVPGDVVSLWGDIVVRHQVQGNAASLLGSVTLEPGARVGGDVLAGAGQIAASSGAIAGRELRGPGGAALSAVLRGSGTATFSPTTARSLAVLLGAIITLALAALVVLLWPQRTLQTSQVLPTRPWLALGLGVLLTALLALLALPVLALLALTVVGLLLVPMLLMVVHLPYVQGLAAVGQALGRQLTGATTTSSALWGVAAQLVLVAGLGLFVPLAGLVAFYMLGSLGLGAWMLERRSLA